MRRRRQGKGSLQPNGRMWRMQFYVDGKLKKEPTGCLLEDRAGAEAVLKLRLAELGMQKAQGVAPGSATVADLYQLVAADYHIKGRSIYSGAKYEWKNHIEKRWGKIKAANFSTAHITAYILARRNEGAANATINRELALVRRAFYLGLKAAPPLVFRVPPFSLLPEDNVRQGFLEQDQYEHLLELLPHPLKALFVCAYHVGTRKGELRKIRWEQVDFEALNIRLTGKQTKNKSPRLLPIYGDMSRWLEEQYANRPPDNPFVFYGRLWGTTPRPISAKLPGWREACKAAGLDELYFHDLRRSAVRNMKRARVQDSVAMRITGHKTRSMYERYDIVNEEDYADAGEQLKAYHAKRKQERAAKLQRVK